MDKESNKIAANTIVQIVGRIIVLAISLFSMKLITNYLGTSGTGYYTTVITYLSFAIVIADFGLFNVIVREISKDSQNSKKLLANAFTLRLISSVLITLLAVGVVFLTDYSKEIKLGVVAASLFPIFNLLSSVYDMLFQYRLRMHNVVYSEVISKIITILLIIITVHYNLGYYVIVLTVGINAILIFVIKALFSGSDLPLSFRFDKKIMIEIAKMSLPLGLVFIVNNIYFKVDSLLIFKFKGAVDVGIYAVAYRVLETTLFAGSYLSSSLKPLLSVSLENDHERAKKAIGQAITYLVFMGLAVAIICLTFPREIILFLSNEQFLGGQTALMILGVTSVFVYISSIFGEILIARDFRKKMIIVSSFILVFNILLNLYLIPRYSYNGAASATLISEILLIFISWLAIRKSVAINLDLVRIFKLILISTGLVTLGIYVRTLNVNFLFNITILMALYFAISYASNAIPRSSFDNFLSSYKRKWLRR